MRPVVVLVVVTLALGSGGCSDGEVRDGGVYCAALQAAEPTLDADVTSELDITARIALYQQLHDQAPLAVEDEWQQVVDLLTAASTVDLTDQSAVAALSDQAFSTTKAAASIVDHAASLCGISLPAVGRLAPPTSTIEVPATTLVATDQPPAT